MATPKSNSVYYYCTSSEADEIERSGRIYCEDLDDDDYDYPRGIFFSNIPPHSGKLKASYFDDFDEDYDAYVRLPKSWVKDQEQSGKWTHSVLDGPGLHRFLLEGNKEYLKIGEADYVSRGDRYDPCDENDIYFVEPGFFFHYTTRDNLLKILSSEIIKSCARHKAFSGIKQNGICLTDADKDAHSDYIKRECFRAGGDSNKLMAYIQLPKNSVYEYAARKGIQVCQYKDGRRSFIVTTDNYPLYLDQIDGWDYGYRDL